MENEWISVAEERRGERFLTLGSNVERKLGSILDVRVSFD